MSILYHGAYMEVPEPLSKAGRKNLDFGLGFYTTRIFDQAQKWAKLVASRYIEAKGIINTYEFDESQFLAQNFIYKKFSSYDMEWLNFVVSCRKGHDTTKYDVIEGGVANDQVIDTIEDYENNRITAEQALDQLQYKHPNNQICIRNQEIINLFLHFKSSEETTDI